MSSPPPKPGPDGRPTFDDPRVYLAGERTLLAWIRTGIALMGLGFVVARFGMFLREIAAGQHGAPPPGAGLSLWIGSGLILLGILTNLHAAAHHLAFVRRLVRGEAYSLPRIPAGAVMATILAILGIAMAIHMIAASR